MLIFVDDILDLRAETFWDWTLIIGIDVEGGIGITLKASVNLFELGSFKVER